MLGIALGNGWSRGRLGWNGNRAFYGDRLAVIAQLELTFADGHQQLVGTDETWRAGPSATLANDLYDGQIIDARRAATWMHAGRRRPGWGGVEALTFDTTPPHALRSGRPVVRHESRRAGADLDVAVGRTLVDFGQNLVGWLRFTVQGEARHRDRRPPRRGPGARRTRRTAAAQRPGHRPVHPSPAAQDRFEPT